ncbi:PulJ/GspJ family protein [Cryobacterium arcticum]|uniref:PulJ/GspJ family protein n=1 Tax=Cryobacterium arcticum TaxID=670052 RepID=UPI0015E85EB2|nr:prepilin-type N-terminal cleavage/methylation domain-containing protein [Cryobacterium arcticum]
MITRIRHRLNRDDQGISLVELLVAMLLLAIVGVIVSGLYSSTMRTVSQARTLNSNTREASNGMNEVSRVIRAGTENPVSGAANQPALETAMRESVTLYAYVNLVSSAELPVKIQLSLDTSRRLIETQWPAIETPVGSGFFTFSTVSSSTRIMAGTVAPQSGSAPYLFTYVLKDGTELTSPTGGLTPAQRQTIAAIKVTMTLQGSATDTRSAVTLQNTVGMPNLPVYRTGP